ncbi:MAG: carboxypeptidase regulatory-like domain-containing protein [Acidobacteriaceae bacterium]|nr:carboxypeptidase regulatory-like domain-containing protein [Acidobacteriaceae bacterium]MBV9763850.1 carboxypeptidase regulatory-like domain-containing protein [Acidobacteriaceae bacterium]
MKMRVRHLTTVLAALVVFQILAPPAAAQFQAGIQGVVVDPNGATVPEAKVTLTSQETTIEHTVTTTGDGVFTISSLAPGNYTLSVEKTGFSKKVLSDVIVTAEKVQSIKVQLDVGQVSQEVTVAAGAPLLDTETAAIGGTISTKEIQSLPSFSRDPYQLLRLAPGTFGDGAQGAGGSGSQLPGTNKNGPGSTDSIFQVENGPAIIANGTRQNENNFQIDGLSVNSTVWGGSAVITPNEESVKEVRVISNNYDAENGRTGGAQVEVVSQNGTNDLHGSAFFKWHRPGLNAYQRWNGPGTPSPVQRDNARFNQFGGSLGGPLWKNKLFAFFSYETLRNNSQTVSTGWFETPQFEANAGPSGSIARQFLSFSGVAPKITQVISETCAEAGLPSTQCHDVAGGLDLGSPLKTPLGTMDPTFGQPGTPFGIGGGFDGIPDAEYVETVGPNINTSTQYNGRMDYDPSSKDAITFSIYWTPVAQHYFNGQRVQDYYNHFSTADAVSAIYTHTFTPTLLNEARFGFSGWYWNEITSNPQLAFGLPDANISNGGVGFQSFGPPGPSVFNQKTYNGRDILTKVQGSHYLKFGADISRALFLDTAPWGAIPTYNFRNLWDFANDAPFTESTNFNPVTGTPTSATKNERFNILAFLCRTTGRSSRTSP